MTTIHMNDGFWWTAPLLCVEPDEEDIDSEEVQNAADEVADTVEEHDVESWGEFINGLFGN